MSGASGVSKVPAASQTLALLRALADRGPSTAAALARTVGAPRSTTYHLLSVLRDEGFVVHLTDRRRWSLGPMAFTVGQAYLRHDPREELARPILRSLADETGETAHLGVLQGAEVLYLVKELPTRRLSAPTLITEVGVRLPAATTASGRCILAQLPHDQVRALMSAPTAFVSRTGRGPQSLSALRRVLAQEREQGYSVEEGEVVPDYASVAAAVTDAAGAPVASISLTFRPERASIEELAPAITSSALALEALLVRGA